ncbi:MAG TPA: SIMPL domain-containing protein [Gaiellaceae bacterium]|nr:SIMPL domain-containing protein [Gaiellaceae bacterium]
MKTLRKSLLLAVVLLGAAALAGVAQPRLAHSAALPADRTITVSGDGAVTTVPDRASFQFGVTTQAATAKDALARNAAAANAVIAALKGAGVQAADLATAGVSLSPVTSDDGTRIVSYTASNSVSARVALARAGALVDTAVAAGADTVYGPNLDLSSRKTLYTQALTKALADAKAKAQALAQAAGLTLGAVQSVAEGGAAPSPVPYAMKAADAGSTPIEPGTQEVDATVTVVYAVS